ncbi:MAG TPA: DUF2231 domain-containing protein [Pyrinomonadaceae bacterium]|nr:DUF2231 domain-containing protein [Pyrinomonadaceae bacterium]
MESKAKILGHPIHQMLIVFPLGLLSTSVIFDLVYWFTNNATFSEVAFWMLLAGVIGGLVAAPFGWIDWFAIKQGTRAKSVGLIHGGGNMIVTGLFALSLVLRWGDQAGHKPDTFALILSVAGFLLALGTAWLGGELVDRLAIGVDDGAHWNAPSSLSGRPASETVSNEDRGKVI